MNDVIQDFPELSPLIQLDKKLLYMSFYTPAMLHE